MHKILRIFKLDREALTDLLLIYFSKGLGYIVILATNPIFYSKLTKEDYGNLAVLWSYAQFMVVLAEMSSPTVGVSRISTYNERIERSKIAMNRIFVLALLFLVAITINEELWYIVLIIPLSSLLNKTYIFHAAGNLKNPALFQLIGRLLSLPFLYFFVIKPSIISAATFVSLQWLLPSLLTNIFGLRSYGIVLPKMSLLHSDYYLQTIYAIFGGSIAFILPLILSYFNNKALVGDWLFVDRSVRPFIALLYPINQFLLAKKTDYKSGLNLVVLVSLLAVLLSILLLSFSDSSVLELSLLYTCLIPLVSIQYYYHNVLAVQIGESKKVSVVGLFQFTFYSIFATITNSLELLVYMILIYEFLMLVLTLSYASNRLKKI